jgi:hypothetical protein
MAGHVGRHAPLLVSDKSGAYECVGVAAIDCRAGRAARATPVAAREKQDAAGCIGAAEALHDLAGIG